MNTLPFYFIACIREPGDRGPGFTRLWVEAEDAKTANSRAEAEGVEFVIEVNLPGEQYAYPWVMAAGLASYLSRNLAVSLADARTRVVLADGSSYGGTL